MTAGLSLSPKIDYFEHRVALEENCFGYRTQISPGKMRYREEVILQTANRHHLIIKPLSQVG